MAFLIMHWRALLAASLVAAAMALSYHFGAATVQAQWDRAKLAQESAAVKDVQRQVGLTAKVDASATVQAEKTRIVYQTLNKEVVRYVASNPVSCALPAGWVRIHNAAAAGEDPAAGTANGSSGQAAADQ